MKYMGYKVKFQQVTKKYKMYNKQTDKLKDLLWNRGKGEYHYALNKISFEVNEGEIVGVIGLNGSGKSTLSNLIAGVTMPNEGTVDINGSASLIAIGAGLNNQLTGLQNIELKGLMMGLNKHQIEEITPKVIEFADIGKFINQPVKTYSSGMKSRLGFAISVNIDPDILVIDEALSVGDQTFTNKCLEKMNEFKENGKTIFFISHSLSQVRSFCTKALWIHYGHVKEYGDITEVADHYAAFLKEYNAMSKEKRDQLKEQQLSESAHGLLMSTGEKSEKKADSKEEEPEFSKRSQRMKQRKDKSAKKRSSKKKVLLSAAILLLAGSAGVAAYAVKNNAPHDKPAVSEQAAPASTSHKNDVDKVAVNTKTAFVRDKADLKSNQKTILSFGEVYSVLDRKKDPDEDMEWIKVKVGEGQVGWVSSYLVAPYTEDKQVVAKENMETLNEFTNVKYDSTIANLLRPLGGSVEHLSQTFTKTLTSQRESNDGNLLNYGSVQYVSLNNKVEEVSLRNFDESSSKVQEALKEKPIFTNEKEGLYFYQSQNYYIKVYEDVKTNKITLISFVKRSNT